MKWTVPSIGTTVRMRWSGMPDGAVTGRVADIVRNGPDWNRYSFVRIAFDNDDVAEALHDDYDDYGRRGVKMPYRTIYLWAFWSALEEQNV